MLSRHVDPSLLTVHCPLTPPTAFSFSRRLSCSSPAASLFPPPRAPLPFSSLFTDNGSSRNAAAFWLRRLQSHSHPGLLCAAAHARAPSGPADPGADIPAEKKASMRKEITSFLKTFGGSFIGSFTVRR